jgi:hypothetical protein
MLPPQVANHLASMHHIFLRLVLRQPLSLEAKSRDEKDGAYRGSPAEEDRMGMQDDEDACLIMQDVPYVDDYGETPLQNFV